MGGGEGGGEWGGGDQVTAEGTSQEAAEKNHSQPPLLTSHLSQPSSGQRNHGYIYTLVQQWMRDNRQHIFLVALSGLYTSGN